MTHGILIEEEGVGSLEWTPSDDLQKCLDKLPPESARLLKKWVVEKMGDYALVLLQASSTAAGMAFIEQETQALAVRVKLRCCTSFNATRRDLN